LTSIKLLRAYDSNMRGKLYIRTAHSFEWLDIRNFHTYVLCNKECISLHMHIFAYYIVPQRHFFLIKKWEIIRIEYVFSIPPYSISLSKSSYVYLLDSRQFHLPTYLAFSLNKIHCHLIFRTLLDIYIQKTLRITKILSSYAETAI